MSASFYFILSFWTLWIFKSHSFIFAFILDQIHHGGGKYKPARIFLYVFECLCQPTPCVVMAKNAIVKEHCLGVSQHYIRLNWFWIVIVRAWCVIRTRVESNFLINIMTIFICWTGRWQKAKKKTHYKIPTTNTVFGHEFCVDFQWIICCEKLHRMKHQVNSLQSANTTRFHNVIRTKEACSLPLALSFSRSLSVSISLESFAYFNSFVYFHLELKEIEFGVL